MNHTTMNHTTADDTTGRRDPSPGLGQHGTKRRIDVAVIGAGLAGLTAALGASHHDTTPIVIDARSPGGRARSAARDGFILNVGAHALYRGGAAADVLRRLGIAAPGGQPPLREYCAWWDGEIVPMPMTAPALLTTRLLGPRSKATAFRLFAGLRTEHALATHSPSLTFDDWLDGHRARPDLARLLHTAARTATYSAEPGRLPARSVLAQLRAASAGVAYLDGGWQALIDSLVAAVHARGIELVTHTPITGLERDGAGWIIHSGDEQVARAAAIVIASGGPAHATELTGSDPGWLEQAGPPLRAASLDVGVDTAATPRPLARYLFSADDPNYVACHAPVARLAPAGHELYSLLRYVADGDDFDATTARHELDRHAARAGLPARSDRILDRFLATMNVTWGTPVAGRPRPNGDELAAASVYVAGDWVGEHLLADAAIDSGLRAGRSAARLVRRAA